MVADFFTKPLQGVAFLRFRNLILNIDSPFDKEENHRSVLDKTGKAGHNTMHHAMAVPLPTLPSARQAGNGKAAARKQD